MIFAEDTDLERFMDRAAVCGADGKFCCAHCQAFGAHVLSTPEASGSKPFAYTTPATESEAS